MNLVLRIIMVVITLLLYLLVNDDLRIVLLLLLLLLLKLNLLILLDEVVSIRYRLAQINPSRESLLLLGQLFTGCLLLGLRLLLLLSATNCLMT